MLATLVAIDDVANIKVDKPIILVGRNDECDVVLDSKKVSRQHCCIAQVKDYLVVRDLGSTNGIRVNGQRIVESKLANGDELMIANLRYRVQCGPAGEGAPQAGYRGRVTDSQLEEADEPVLLSDPEGSPNYPPPPPAPRRQSERAAGSPPNAPMTPPPPVPPHHSDEEPDSKSWFDIPDPENVDLASSSDLGRSPDIGK